MTGVDLQRRSVLFWAARDGGWTEQRQMISHRRRSHCRSPSATSRPRPAVPPWRLPWPASTASSVSACSPPTRRRSNSAPRPRPPSPPRPSHVPTASYLTLSVAHAFFVFGLTCLIGHSSFFEAWIRRQSQAGRVTFYRHHRKSIVHRTLTLLLPACCVGPAPAVSFPLPFERAAREQPWLSWPPTRPKSCHRYRGTLVVVVMGQYFPVLENTCSQAYNTSAGAGSHRPGARQDAIHGPAQAQH